VASGKMESLKASRTPDSIDNDQYTGITNGQVYFTDMKEGRKIEEPLSPSGIMGYYLSSADEFRNTLLVKRIQL
jgi:hypothetical protein